MSSVTIKTVSTRDELKEFINFHYDLYEGNKYDVPDLFSDEMDTLSKSRNAAFDFCEAQYFLAYKKEKLVGRVAAIINHKANTRWGRKAVRFGWIDFVDDREVSAALMNAVERWGRAKGMDELVGPLGFTDMDPEGMLTFGFDKLGTMPTIYNYPYYPEHFKAMDGYEKDNEYVEYYLKVPEKTPEKYIKIAKIVEQRYNLHVKKLTKDDVFRGGYGYKIFELINNTYKDLYGYSELSHRQILQYIDRYLKYINLDFVTVIEDGNKENCIAGVGITMPSLSHALQKCHRGKLLPFGWWYMLKAIKFIDTDGVDLLLVGFLPEYRAKGANALLFADLIPRYIKYGLKWGETQVEMADNNGVQAQWGPLNPINHKRRCCFKKFI